MEDSFIVDLYWERNERAITETGNKYGRLLQSTSYNLLSSREDAEECVNDTYIAAWNSMPTARPQFLASFLTRIVRNISISRFREIHREKRGGGDIIEELTECVPDSDTVESQYRDTELSLAINGYLSGLGDEKRAVFIRRYFWTQDISVISKETRISESAVKTMLFRMRGELKNVLERKGLL